VRVCEAEVGIGIFPCEVRYRQGVKDIVSTIEGERAMRKVALASLCVLLAASFAWANYIDLPVKWSQLVDRSGQGYYSNHIGQPDIGHGPQVYVDDFVCDDPDPIVAARWWGAYPEPYPIHNHGGHAVGPFDITFHHSTGPHSQSIPADLITQYTVYAQEVYVGHDSTNQYAIYRYDAYLPQAFDQWRYSQQPGPNNDWNVGELFFGVCQPTDSEFWYWWETLPPHPVMDSAKWATTHNGVWNAGQTNGSDMAFELMTPEPGTIALLILGGLAGLAGRRR